MQRRFLQSATFTVAAGLQKVNEIPVKSGAGEGSARGAKPWICMTLHDIKASKRDPFLHLRVFWGRSASAPL